MLCIDTPESQEIIQTLLYLVLKQIELFKTQLENGLKQLTHKIGHSKEIPSLAKTF